MTLQSTSQATGKFSLLSQSGFSVKSILLLALLCFISLGCFEKKDKQDSSVNKESDPTEPYHRWVLVVSAPEGEYYTLLIDVEEGESDAAPDIRIFERAFQFQEWKLDKATLEFPSIELEMTSPRGKKVYFRGTQRDSVVYGAIQFPKGGVFPRVPTRENSHNMKIVSSNTAFPARLEQTKEVELRAYHKPLPSENTSEYLEALKKPGEFGKLKRFIKSHPENPFCLTVYGQLLSIAKEEGLDDKEIFKLAEEYIALSNYWGRALLPEAYTNSIGLLSSLHCDSELIRQLVAEAKNVSDITSPQRQMEINISFGVALLGSADVGRQKEGIDLLETLLKEAPENSNKNALSSLIIPSLARCYEENGDLEKAIRLYSEMAVTPGLAGYVVQTTANSPGFDEPVNARKKAKELLEKSGKGEELEASLGRAYHEVMESFMKSKKALQEKPLANQRVVLCELFTGSQCGPCVAADIATGIVEREFSKKRLIVLRYHQHIPGPDPLTNSVGESRFSFYNPLFVVVEEGSSTVRKGTPTVLLNGGKTPFMGGGFSFSKIRGAALSQLVTSEVAKTTDVKINLDVQVKGDDILLSGTVKGIPKSEESLSLRFVLAEDQVYYPARNQIREHEMLVRAMPGGLRGLAIDEGEKRFEVKFNIASIRNDLEANLTQLEGKLTALKKSAGRSGSFTFRHKPLDLKKLHIVAFVQRNFSEREMDQKILQAIAVPVPGEFSIPKKAKAVVKEPKKEPKKEPQKEPVLPEKSE